MLCWVMAGMSRLSYVAANRSLELFQSQLGDGCQLGYRPTFGDQMSDIETQIQAHIQKFVVELNDLVRRAAIKAVTEALGSNVTAARPASPRPPKATKAKARQRRGGRRSPRAMKKDQEGLVTYITAHPGELMEDIAKALGSSSKEMARPVSKLIAAGTVRRVGERRASRYFPAEAKTSKKAGPKKRPPAKKQRAKQGPRKKASKRLARMR